MNEAILTSNAQQFIRSYNEPLTKLAFQGSPFPEISTQELLEQIDAFQRSKRKLPIWHETSGIYYPPKLNLEQTSSEQTAQYKAGLLIGDKIADLTGGFGVDSYFFSKYFKEVHYFERNEGLAQIAFHNFKLLKASNIKVNAINSFEGIKNEHYDVIYVDPARRHESKGKVFKLADTEPNVIANFDYLMHRCENLIIKTSPMLDITEALRELNWVKELHVVAVQNEVKELLWIIERNYVGPQGIKTINFNQETTEEFQFIRNESTSILYSPPLQYLYEPNAAIMKGAGYEHLSHYYTVKKIGVHAHLFTSDELINFPGRRFRVNEVRDYKKGALNDFKNKQAHLTIRDFPESVATLRKKWGIKEGGEQYLFFTTLQEGQKVVLITQKV